MNKIPEQHLKQNELYKLLIAEHDFKEAIAGCDVMLYIGISEAGALYQPLLNSLILAYSRPFSWNQPMGKLESKWNEWYGEKENWLHKQMLGLRNTAIAHSDSQMHKVIIYPIGTICNTEAAHGITSADLKLEHIPAIKEMCVGLLNRICPRIIELKAYLYPNGSIPPNGKYWELDYKSLGMEQ